MKLQRLFCFLLAFVCIFSGLFSVSASAYDVNGFEVTTGAFNYQFPVPGYDDFTTTITYSSTNDPLKIIAKITFPEPLKKNSIFDFALDVHLDNYNSVDVTYYLHYTDREDYSMLDATLTDKRVVLKDLVTDGECDQIVFYFTINNPIWREQIIDSPLDITNLSGTTWFFPSGWSANAGYGIYTFDGSISYNNYTGGMDYHDIDTFQIGYNGPESLIDDSVMFQLITGTKYRLPSTSAFTLTFNSGSSLNDPDLISWVKTYGELQTNGSDSGTEDNTSYVGTWLLNPTVSYDGTSTIQFDDVVGKFYGKKNSSSSSLVEYDIARIELSPTGTIFNVKNMYNLSSGYCYTSFGFNTWKSVYYSSTSSSTSYTTSSDLIRTLVITEEPNNETFKNWLSTNATLQSTYDLSLASIVNYTYNFTITNVSFDVTQSGEEYSGIIGWIRNVFNGITGLPARIANSIGNFFSTLGQKIVDLGISILDGIKGLFIPTEDDVTSIKGRFEQLLDDRFGAVYDSTEIIDDFANAFTTESQAAMIDSEGANGYVSFPSVTVNLLGTDFTFGGWEVDLIPDKFEFLIDILKMVTNIACTFLLVNSLRRRLESLLK